MDILFVWCLIIDNSHESIPSHSLNFYPYPQLHVFLLREFFQSPDYLSHKYTDKRQQWWITTKATQTLSSLLPRICPNHNRGLKMYMLLCVCVWKWKSFSRVWLFVTPWTVHGILQARILEWVAFPFSREFSQPRDWTQVSHIAGKFFTSWATREAQEHWSG